MRSAGLALVWLTLGCGGGDDESSPVVTAAASCAAGEWQREDGSCVPAGLPPDMLCPPGEWQRDGECIPAGVPPDDCASGFVPGDRSCEPILPVAPCPLGLMAVPGEESCRPVAPCAAGTWGDIPIEPSTEHVDGSYANLDSDGSALKPWTTIQAAVDAALPGAIIAIAAGGYVEDVRVSAKPVRLWGVCPFLVELAGTGAEQAALLVFAGASGTEVRDLAIVGDLDGVGVSGSRDVLLERVWVHHSVGRGVNVQADLGPTSITLRGSLVELNHDIGLLAAGSQASVDASVIRATLLYPQGGGRGMSVQAQSTTPATLDMHRSLLEQNDETGVFVQGSHATVEATVIRDAQGLSGRGVELSADPVTGPATLELRTSFLSRNSQFGLFIAGSEANVQTTVIRQTQLDQDGLFGRGVNVRAHETTLAPSTLALRASLLEENHDIGVFVEGSHATLEASVIRQTQPDAQGKQGRGINVRAELTSGAPATLELFTSLLEQNHELGLFAEASQVTVEASVVRETQPNGHSLGGRGVNVQSGATLVLRSSLVERNHDIGLFIAGSQANVETCVIRETQLDASGLSGRGIDVQAHSKTDAPSTVVLTRSTIEHNYEGGVFILGSVATVDACLVRDTQPNALGQFGSGVIVEADPGAASATVNATRVDRSALAAVATWGSYTALGSSAFSCQAFDLDHESYRGIPATLDDLGGNRCGCPDPTGICKAVTANLEAPQAVAE